MFGVDPIVNRLPCGSGGSIENSHPFFLCRILEIPRFGRCEVCDGQGEVAAATAATRRAQIAISQSKLRPVTLAQLRAVLFLVLVIAALGGRAEELIGKVVAVADGDTLTVLVDRIQMKVRLTEIDAPEKTQPFGNRSKQSLADLTFGKVVRVVTRSKDRYGRALGRVYVGNQDVNAEQVRRGMAWVYDRFVTDQSLYGSQIEARAARRGLWAEPNPVPPWEWRRGARM